MCGDAKAKMMKFFKEQKKEKQSVQSRRKIVTTILLCLCIAFIWHNSLEGAELSGNRSLIVTRTLNDWLLDGSYMVLAETVVRKLAHFLEYALEGTLVTSVIWAYELEMRRYVCQVVLAGVLTALIDETFQLFMEGRAASVGDIWIDLFGFIFGVLAGVSWMLIKRKIRARALD